MLDLKAKLAAAGLVTPADVAAAERKQKPKPSQRPPAKPQTGPKPDKPDRGPGLDVPALRKAGKGAAYDAIRRAVERARLDGAAPTAAGGPFHFTTATGQLSRLILEPQTQQAITAGTAGITAFMSHHGLAHAVVPRPLAEAIAELFPFWLRTLLSHPGAGQLEPRPQKPAEPPPPAPPADPPPSATPPAAPETT